MSCKLLIFLDMFTHLYKCINLLSQKNHIFIFSICGTLHSVDQFLNIKLTDISVTDPDKYPHMVRSFAIDFSVCVLILQQVLPVAKKVRGSECLNHCIMILNISVIVFLIVLHNYRNSCCIVLGSVHVVSQ